MKTIKIKEKIKNYFKIIMKFKLLIDLSNCVNIIHLKYRISLFIMQFKKIKKIY